MNARKLIALGGLAVGAWGLGKVINGLLPTSFDLTTWHGKQPTTSTPDASTLPEVTISFLRCGSITLPELIAVRGSLSLAPRVIAHSAVLIRHPQATFLYDTGLSSDIQLYLADRTLFFRKTLGNFTFEQSLSDHLLQHNLKRTDLAFALLSHLHWDHVSGVPDLPGVPLRVNRVEYEAAHYTIFAQHGGLTRQLLGNNPIECFDCTGPAYESFRSSLDLFGDGSIVLVPLPGHTAGNTGMFINRSNGPRIFLLGDAVWVAENYLIPATMHPFIWSRVTGDDATARQTLLDLHHFALAHPEIPMIAMHDAHLQDAFAALSPGLNEITTT